MDNIEIIDHANAIGLDAEDSITGLSGTVSAVLFLAGDAVEYRLDRLNADGNNITQTWFSAGRLTLEG